MADLNANDLDAADEDHRRHRPLDGRHRRGLTSPTTAHVGGPRAARRPHLPTPSRTRSSSEAQQGLPRRRRADRRDDRLYQPRSRRCGWPRRPAATKFDATVEVALRLGVDPRKADQMVRGTVNLPHGTGKTARVLVFANGAEGRGGACRRRRLRRRRRPHREGRRRLDRLRRRRRHPGPHGQGRPARPRARSARPDAQPEDRHRDDGRDQGGRRDQGRQDRVPRRQARQPALRHRQGVVLRAAAGRELRRGARRGAAAQAVRGQGPLRARRPSSPPRWARASRSTPRRPRWRPARPPAPLPR